MFSSTQSVTEAGSGRRGARPEDKLTGLPVTIQSIKKAAQESSEQGTDLKFFGFKPTMLLLVAGVESAEKSQTLCTMTLNDTTGKLQARYYGTDEAQLASMTEGKYMVLFGTVCTVPSLHLTVNGVREIESADEISYHMLECAHSALKLMKVQGDQPMTPSPKKPVPAKEALGDKGDEPMEMSPEKLQMPQALAKTPEAPVVEKAMTEGELREAITNLLKQLSEAAGETGVDIAEISGKLPSAKRSEIQAILVKMEQDGDAFKTIDDDHFSTF